MLNITLGFFIVNVSNRDTIISKKLLEGFLIETI